MTGLGSHTFAEGVIDYYHLTGDRRARDIGWNTGLSLGQQFQLHCWGLSRNTGWGSLTTGATHQIKPHEEITKGAYDLLKSCCRDAGISLDDDNKAFEGIFLRDRFVNLAMRGMIRWHQVTGDPKFKKAICRIMEGYVERGFFEDGLPLQDTEPEGRYASMAAQGFANLESLAYAYRLRATSVTSMPALPTSAVLSTGCSIPIQGAVTSPRHIGRCVASFRSWPWLMNWTCLNTCPALAVGSVDVKANHATMIKTRYLEALCATPR